MNTKQLELLKDIYQHFDGIADGAPDASYAAKQALNFSEPLKQLIASAQDDGASYYSDNAANLIYEDVARAEVNALISIAISLQRR